MAESSNRNLPASARKLSRAREEGQVARSRDLSHLAIVGGGGAVLLAAGPWLLESVQRLLLAGLRFEVRDATEPEAMLMRLSEVTGAFLTIVVPMGVVVALLSAAAAVASGGWNLTFKTLGFKLSHLDPITGFGRMFTGSHLGNLLKACALALVIGAIGGLYLSTHMAEFHATLAMPLPTALAHTGQALVAGLGLLVLALGVSSAIDVPLQRHLLANQLKMSIEEVKQEMKDAEGNVEVKAKVKARMREVVRRRMFAAVPQADLVVMNPTHYAVALKYDDTRMGAPRVVAKGADLIALRIRDIAQESRVPVLRAPALARALYAHTELDDEIPARLFTAVAQVLAHVYQLRAALAGRGAWPAELPDIAVPPDLDPHQLHPGRAQPMEADA